MNEGLLLCLQRRFTLWRIDEVLVGQPVVKASAKVSLLLLWALEPFGYELSETAF